MKQTTIIIVWRLRGNGALLVYALDSSDSDLISRFRSYNRFSDFGLMVAALYGMATWCQGLKRRFRTVVLAYLEFRTDAG
jgi:hypothetical protein